MVHFNYATDEERLSAEDFVAAVEAYPSLGDAIEDGVGQSHTFPPRGYAEYRWEKIVRHHFAIVETEARYNDVMNS